MIKYSVYILQLAVIICLAGVSFLAADVERHPTATGASVDMGQIITGKLIGITPADTSDADGQFLSRVGAFISESATINDRIDINFTLGGLFFYGLPEKANQGIQRFPQPGLGIGQAQIVYKFGDPESPWSSLRFGLFPIKYNPDAKNLGEYLYRSGSYPGLIYGGGWTYVGGAAYMGQGLKYTITHLNGALTHDFSLTLERDLQPINDFSPAYMATFRISNYLEVGAGVMWSHGLALKDSLTTPQNGQNAYVRDDIDLPAEYQSIKGLPLNYGDPISTQVLIAPHYNTGDPRIKNDGDPCLTDFSVTCEDGTTNTGTFVSKTDNGIPGEYLGYYTFKGWKGIFRAGLDLGTLMGMEEGTFKLYGEVALLGFKNYPFYYEDRMERMPVMFGINFPTFGLLDMFSVEVEYLKSRFPNDLESVFRNKWPLPLPDETLAPVVYDLDASAHTDPNDSLREIVLEYLGLEDDPRYNVNHPSYNPANAANPDLRPLLEEKFEKDDWRWSVFLKRQVVEGFSISAQVASDHQRQIGFDSYAPKPTNFPTTRYSSDWYYVIRLEVGI